MIVRFVSLKLTRYSDTQSILSAYSRELGRVSFAVPAGKGRGASRLRALTMPLGIVECVTELKGGRDVVPLRQAMRVTALSSLNSDPVKQMLAMLLTEILSVTLQTGEPDKVLFDFLERSINFLDAADAKHTANFHLCFLFQLGRHLGIEPDVSTYRPGAVFDLMDGCWRRISPLHNRYLSPEESLVAYNLSRMTFRNLASFRFSRTQRNRILDLMLEYYSIHYASLRTIRSLDIVRGML